MSKKLTTEEFIERAKLIHGDKYDYSVSEYIGYHNKIKIKCKKCGKVFEQFVSKHLSGSNCNICHNGETASLEKFIERAKLIHGDKYDYSLVEYKNSKTKITIKCNDCGKIFEQFPFNHLDGHGCKCNKRNIKLDFQKEYNCKTEEDFAKEYFDLIERNLKNTKGDEIHHILPKSIYPLLKSKDYNLVYLSFEDHYRAHYLLSNFIKNKMALAFRLMIGESGKAYNPKLYAEQKAKAYEEMSIKVFCFELNKEFNSIREAAKYVKLKTTYRLRNACKNWSHSSGCFHWCYLEDKNKAIEFWINKIKSEEKAEYNISGGGQYCSNPFLYKTEEEKKIIYEKMSKTRTGISSKVAGKRIKHTKKETLPKEEISKKFKKINREKLGKEIIVMETEEVFNSAGDFMDKYGVPSDTSWISKAARSNGLKKALGFHICYKENYSREDNKWLGKERENISPKLGRKQTSDMSKSI